ncbi:hypothetical protein D3C75_1095110 [compost metagenome]
MQHVKPADFIQYLAGLCGVFVFQRQGDDAGLFAALIGLQVVLILQNGVEVTLLGDAEHGPGIGVEGGDLHLEAILLELLARLAA